MATWIDSHAVRRCAYCAILIALVAGKALAQIAIGSGEYAARRAAARARMTPRSVAVFHSAPDYPRTSSSDFPFRQSNNLLYLTGCTEERVSLALFASPV